MNNDLNADQVQSLLLIEKDKAHRAQLAFEQYFQPFFAEEEALLINVFRSAPVGDKEGLADIHHRFKTLDNMRQRLITTIQTGLLAQEQLEQMAKEKLQ